jgi:predicted phosphodiesterase
MRIALLSDIHGNLAALEAVEQDLLKRGVDAVVNLGDSLSGPLLPRETAAFLMARDWVQLAGNHERQLLEYSPEQRGASDAYTHDQLTERELEWLASLASVRGLGDGTLFCHGTPACDSTHLLVTIEPTGMRIATQAEVDQHLRQVMVPLIACGHTHLPLCRSSSRGQLIVNPGSVGLQAYLDSSPYPYAIETRTPHARYAIVERQGDTWSAELLSVPYDAEAMALLARARGFILWEGALRTGCLPSSA